jgi:glutathione S-transferase
MASTLITMTVSAIGLAVGEGFYGRSALPAVYAPSSLLPLLPRAYSGVLFFNVIGSSITLIILGGKVGGARKKFQEKAEKDGDKEAEDRFSYPKLYAEGFSKHAKEFNCVQRGHQQALETYTSFVVLSLIGGIKFPLVSALGGLIWNVARLKWAEGYATGDPMKRYSSAISFGIWLSLLLELATATATVLAIADLI